MKNPVNEIGSNCEVRRKPETSDIPSPRKQSVPRKREREVTK